MQFFRFVKTAFVLCVTIDSEGQVLQSGGAVVAILTSGHGVHASGSAEMQTVES